MSIKCSFNVFCISSTASRYGSFKVMRNILFRFCNYIPIQTFFDCTQCAQHLCQLCTPRRVSYSSRSCYDRVRLDFENNTSNSSQVGQRGFTLGMNKVEISQQVGSEQKELHLDDRLSQADPGPGSERDQGAGGASSSLQKSLWQWERDREVIWIWDQVKRCPQSGTWSEAVWVGPNCRIVVSAEQIGDDDRVLGDEVTRNTKHSWDKTVLAGGNVKSRTTQMSIFILCHGFYLCVYMLTHSNLGDKY